MASSAAVPWGRVATAALAAGVTGAVTIDLFLWFATVLPVHGSMLGVWQFIASTALGKVAFSSTSYAAIGLAMHVAVSVGWAGGYAYLSSTRPFMNERWPISGLIYGVVVYLLMQIVLLVDNNFVYPPNPNAFVIAVIAHTAFFGLPVAYVVHALFRRAA